MSCTFQDKWLAYDFYKFWLQKVPNNENAGFCKLCRKTIDLTSMGHSAIKSHMKGQKHKTLIESLQTQQTLNDVVPQSAPVCSTATTSASVPATKSGTILNYISKNQSLTAEIWWCLNTIMQNYSFNSNEDIGFLFKQMFNDSEIAKDFTCGKTKSMYLCVFGIAPYFELLLERKVKGEPYVLLFDESLNQDLQKKQMDILVRHWEDNKVLSRYYTSDFLGHACATDLVGTFENKVEKKLGLLNIVQLSMDGPNVNWAAFDKLENKIEKEYNTKLINVGSCGLHTVHNAVRAGVNATKWDVSDQLSAMHTLFDNVPARREDYEEVTQSNLYPLAFCAHRWVENVRVIERALEVIPYLQKYFDAVEKKKVKNPGTKSCETVKAMLKDPFTKARLTFILSVAKQVESFLIVYQCDKPMIPFLANDLAELLRRCLERFVKSSVMEEANTIVKLLKVEHSKKENRKILKEVDLGFVAQSEVRAIENGKKASDLQVMEYRRQCVDFLDKLVTKINEKSPLAYSLVRYLASLNPVLFSLDEEKTQDRFRRVLNALSNLKRVKLQDCDKIYAEFKKFVSSNKHKSTFKDFDKSSDRVDTLFYTEMHDIAEYKNVWPIISLLLLLSHGQATVERGFSVNKEVSELHLKEECLVAKRVIKDHVKCIGGLQCMSITKELLQYAKSARQRYHDNLEENRVEKERRKKGEKRRQVEEELKELRKKAKLVQESINLLDNDADKAADKAENLQSIPHITESNSLRKKSREKAEDLSKLNKLIQDKSQELSNM